MSQEEISDDQFFDAVRDSGASDGEIAHEFGMSRPSVDRWRARRSAPYPSMRRHVLEGLKAVVDRRQAG